MAGNETPRLEKIRRVSASAFNRAWNFGGDAFDLLEPDERQESENGFSLRGSSRDSESAMSKILTGLSAMSGGNILGFAILGSLLIGGGSYVTGYVKGSNAEKAAEALREQNSQKLLDGKSVDVSADIEKIASELGEKINKRVAGQAQVNTYAIEDAARKIGKLEGEADGYKQGFEDAKTITGSCYNDPKFLSDSVRVGARARYEAVFGSTPQLGPLAGPAVVSGNGQGNARGYPTD